ncbi:MAG: NTP transferase domain-containing protein [Pirellulales bacterium]|nr:NTP transferase domain-containing protein [Pirellulales bacterium]
MPGPVPSHTIILAAGKGTRMQSATLPKACFPVNGVPAINRALDIYNRCGIRHHTLVVGTLAGVVVETVGKAFDNVSFVYQKNAAGTADAARTGLAPFDARDDDADVLILAGDRIIDPPVLERLFDQYYSRNLALALLATPTRPGSSQGRLVLDGRGKLLAVVEHPDIRQRRTLGRLRNLALQAGSLSRPELLSLLKQGFSHKGVHASDDKLKRAFGPIYELLTGEEPAVNANALLELIPESATHFAFAPAGESPFILTPDEIEASAWSNNSVYLTRISHLKHALSKLTRDNAQREEYLSDVVGLLAAQTEGANRCEPLNVDDPSRILGFNDPAELLEVERRLREKTAGKTIGGPPLCAWCKPVADWLDEFDEPDEILQNALAGIYGGDAAVVSERIAAWRSLLERTASILGTNAPVLLARSPGRVNAMGRHIDHQGGNCNLMTIGFETLLAAHVRADDRVALHHLDPERFPGSSFSMSELLSDLPWDDWLSLVNSEKVSALGRTYGGDWSQYIRAPLLRLQKKFRDRPLSGMDLVVSGNIPMAAGLSSSSSLVVTTAEAAVAASGLDTFPSQLIDLCGEGEWFVGTRGGSADHAAVKSGERGKVIRVAFFDFAVEETVPFPDTHALVVCDSGISAKKTVDAKDQFNHRIACYHLGFKLIQRLFPQYAPLLKRLRDVNMRNLRVPLSAIYRILLHLPEQATRGELAELFNGEDISALFAAHKPPEQGLYPVRGVVLFGLAECERARRYSTLLKAGDMQAIGALMNVSHDGDRVSRDGKSWQSPANNAYLLSLMDDLDSGDPDRVLRAQLERQPGAYGCSLPDIDRMVDISLSVPGVLGAQLAGAGLGGCMMVLCESAATGTLRKTLTERYYAPAAKPPSIFTCRPIGGAGVLLKECKRSQGTVPIFAAQKMMVP